MSKVTMTLSTFRAEQMLYGFAQVVLQSIINSLAAKGIGYRWMISNPMCSSFDSYH